MSEANEMNPFERVVMWTKYTDSTNHPELKAGKKYCVRTADGHECYAKFVVYDCGTEISFIDIGHGSNGRGLDVVEFRELDKDLDLYT